MKKKSIVLMASLLMASSLNTFAAGNGTHTKCQPFFRNTSGAFASREGGYMTVKKLGGWESLDCDLRGHIMGHLLSAYATLYAQTGSKAVSNT